jgi:hypothetical protein
MNDWCRAQWTWVCALYLVLAGAAFGQTIRPVVIEYQQEGIGRLELVNDGLLPLGVVLEAKAFSVSEKGSISYSELPKSVHLKLSATSFRIAPKQTYTVFYEAKADTLPAWFVVYALMSPLPVRGATGMRVQVELPHTVYLLAKTKVNKEDIQVERAEFDGSAKKVILSVVNHAGNVARILNISVTGKKAHADSNGLPLFPNTRRVIDIQWQGDDLPTKVELRSERFKIEVAVPFVSK